MDMFIVLAIPILIAAVVYLQARSRSAPAAARTAFSLDAETVERLPDHIRLVGADLGAAHVPSAMAQTAEPLAELGFEDAGTFWIEGIPNLRVRLLVNPGQSIYAAIYQHSVGGSWLELVTQYPGGGQSTFTNLTDSGLNPRPGHTFTRDRSAGPVGLYERALRERAMGVFKQVTVASVVSDFENGYALWMAWIRSQRRAGSYSKAA